MSSASIIAWHLTFPGLYDFIVIVDHQMHHARHGWYQGSLSETGEHLLRISDGGVNNGIYASR